MNYSYPKKMQQIINFFKLLPGVGEKTAERYAFSLLKLDDSQIDNLSESLKEFKIQVVSCPICGCLTDANNCLICDDETRNSNIICVVENQKNVFIFEKIGLFKSKYHVLGGLISPIDGVNPENLTIDKLINRIEKENIEEIVLALRPGIEGNTTSLYIRKILENKDVKVTQIAQGVPLGTDMEYLDILTLEMALQNRNEIT